MLPPLMAAALGFLLCTAPGNAAPAEESDAFDFGVDRFDLGPSFSLSDSPSGGYVTNFLGRLMYDYSQQSQFLPRSARNNPKGFLLGALGITALVLTDQTTNGALQPQRHSDDPTVVRSATTLSKWGNTSSSVPLVLGFGALGFLTGSTREKETATMLAEALITSGTWTFLLKTVSGRERPREIDGRTSDWNGPSNVFSDEPISVGGYRSFPSGHATGAWAVATILGNQYPSYRIVPILAYGGASAISYSRMVLGAHWLSDVVVGGLIGFGCAQQVLSSHHPTHTPTDEGRFHIGLDVRREYKGVSLTLGF